MHSYQKSFIELALAANALSFGEFTLKSGRVSPYFFNAGLFYSGKSLAELGRCYAAALETSGLQYDILFGPAYKGITLAATTAVALADQHSRDVPYVYNRKEKKDHGEGGTLVGAPMQGKVVIIDDVITAGTAIREAITMIQDAGAEVAGVLIGLNRQEKGQDNRSAIQQLEQDYGFPVLSIIGLNDIITYLKGDNASPELLASIEQYRSDYGV